MSGDIFSLSRLYKWLVASSRWKPEMDAAKHPRMHRAAPHNKELSCPNVNSADVQQLFQ